MAAPERTIQITVPAEVYERIRLVAAKTDRTIEALLLETVTQHFEASPDLEADLATYTDEQLLEIIRRPAENDAILGLEALLEQREAGTLTAAEALELSRLEQKLDEQVLLRSIAFALLHERGHDVSQYFTMPIH